MRQPFESIEPVIEGNEVAEQKKQQLFEKMRQPFEKIRQLLKKIN